MRYIYILVIDGCGQSLCLLINKGPRAGCTWTVGIKVIKLPAVIVMIDLKKGRVLASHADDRSYVRFYAQSPQHLANGFKFIKATHPLADLLPVIPCESKGLEILAAQFLIQFMDKP